MIETIIPLIPVALFIAFRIIEMRRKEAAQQKPKSDISFIETDEEEPPSERILITEEEPITPPLAVIEPQPPQASNTDTLQTKEKNKFPDTLNRLSPLKRGIVWAEILGSPKSLQV